MRLCTKVLPSWIVLGTLFVAFLATATRGQPTATTPASDADFAHSTDAALISSLKLRHVSSSPLEQQLLNLGDHLKTGHTLSVQNRPTVWPKT
jgi:hypothetical protein